MTELEVAPIASGDAEALVDLFTGEHSLCYCRFWHFSGTSKEWEARCALDPERNRADLVEAVRRQTDDGRGVIARLARPEGAPSSSHTPVIGWLKLAPRRSLTKLLERAPYRALGESAGAPGPDEVMSIGCVLVSSDHRHRGVARALLEGAILHAARLGATWIEAYPRATGEPMHDGEAWMGPLSMYEGLGFERVDGAQPGGATLAMAQYPVMRRRLR